VTGVLQRLRSRNLPERVDAEYLRDAGVPDSLNARTLFAFRFLGLINDDAPTNALRTIARSTDEEYQTTLAGLLREAYRDVFETMDPAHDPQERIVNFFRRYTPASQRQRMVIFFLGMCREAGIVTVDAPRNRASSVSGSSKPVAKPSRSATRTASRTVAPSSAPKGIEAGKGVVGLHPTLELLVRSLPSEGTPFPTARRNQWLDMARATLAFLYPDEEINGFDDQQEDELDDEES
jgi:hypothetical protein